MAYGFRSGRTPEGALACALPVIHGAFRQARLSEVMGEQLRLGFDRIRPPLLQHAGDARVQFPAWAAQQCGVCGILHERVLEHVAGVRRCAVTER